MIVWGPVEVNTHYDAFWSFAEVLMFAVRKRDGEDGQRRLGSEQTFFTFCRRLLVFKNAKKNHSR